MCRSGKAKYENGGVYEGEFENDMRDGWGSHCFPDESIYVGEWAHDKIAGDSLSRHFLDSRSIQQQCIVFYRRMELQSQAGTRSPQVWI